MNGQRVRNVNGWLGQRAGRHLRPPGIVFATRLTAILLASLLGFGGLLSGDQIQTAEAQAIRTWVSGLGSDANPCSRTAPCLTFAGAITKTATGGEINALDPGDFGPVTITKSISLIVDSVTGGVLVGSGSAITVNAGADGVVVIRGLDINGAGTATTGIRFQSGKALFVEDTQVYGFTGDAILANLATTGEVHIASSQLRNNGGAGVQASTSSGLLTVTVDGSQLMNNGVGLDARDNTTTTVTGSMVAGNSNVGLRSQADTTSAALAVADSIMTFNPIGIQVGGGAGNRPASLGLTRTDILSNDTAVGAGTGVTAGSSGDNRIAGNIEGNIQFPTFIPTLTLTPTATLIPTETPTLTPTITVTPSLTATATLTKTPTTTMTLTPTVSATPNTTMTLTPTASATPTQCNPRPNVDVEVAQTGPGGLISVTVSANTNPGTVTNLLRQLQFGPAVNATFSIPTGPTDSSSTLVFTLPPNLTAYVFTVRRQGPGPFQVPFVAVDDCGSWPTFVGGGNGVN